MSKPEADGGVAIESTPLLACPFCGNPPKLFEWDNGDTASVECAGPCLLKDVTTGRYCGKARAIEAWNVRANARKMFVMGKNAKRGCFSSRSKTLLAASDYHFDTCRDWEEIASHLDSTPDRSAAQHGKDERHRQGVEEAAPEGHFKALRRVEMPGDDAGDAPQQGDKDHQGDGACVGQ